MIMNGFEQISNFYINLLMVSYYDLNNIDDIVQKLY